jgi:hypothetical protein
VPTRLRFIFSGPENAGHALCGNVALSALENYWRSWKANHFMQSMGRFPVTSIPIPSHKTKLERALWLWNNLPPNYKQAAHFTVVRDRRSQNWLRSPAHPNNLGLISSKRMKANKWKLEVADLEYHPSVGLAAALGQHKPAPKQRKRTVNYGSNIPVTTQAGESAPSKAAKPSLRIGVWS